MAQRLNDFITLSFFGLIKVSLFILFFCLSILFFFKSKDLAFEETPAFSSLNIHQGDGDYLTFGPASEESEAPEIENFTPEEAGVYFFILRLSESISQENARKLAKLIVEECGNYENLDPYLVLAVIQVESEFSPKAVSKKGAIGLMQVMPGTAEFVAKEMGITYNGRKSLYDPFINVKLGIHYLFILTNRYDSTENALDAYNTGPSNFEKSPCSDKKQSRYVKKVLNLKSYLEEESLLLAKTT
ncbi:MAG: lytic transglycosylase domain-containing protein [Thermodesulfobacteriota bacterium]